MDKVSIIVPIYNVGSYLSVCLNSIANQSYKNIEVVLVDDGSTDSSPEVCERFAVNDARSIVIHKPNEGLVRARKTGLQASTGKYIAYVDGDDWIESDMIEHLYDALIKNDVDIAMCGRFEDTGDTRREVFHGIAEGRYNKQDLIDKVYPNMIVNRAFFEWGIFPGVWDKLWKKEVLYEYQMAVDDELTMGEDAACVYPALLNANSIYILRECLYHYRQSAESMVKKTVDVKLQRYRFSKLFNSVNRLLDKYSYIYDLREQWKEYILFLMVPRAASLYQGVEDLDYLFPFSNVKKGSRIIIYGMGTYGQLLYKFVKQSKFCEVVACADRNYSELNKQGLDVIAPDDIGKYEYDYIIVANSFANVRDSVYRDLSSRYGEENIHVMDVELIKNDETMRAFGLLS